MPRTNGSMVIPKEYVLSRALQAEFRKNNPSISRWVENLDMETLMFHDELSPVEKKDFEYCAKVIESKTERPAYQYFVDMYARLTFLEGVLGVDDLDLEEATKKDEGPLWDQKELLEKLSDLEASNNFIEAVRKSKASNSPTEKMKRFQRFILRLKDLFIWTDKSGTDKSGTDKSGTDKSGTDKPGKS